MHEPADPVGRLLFNCLAMVAGFKADLIKARTGEGKAVAYAARWAWCNPTEGPRPPSMNRFPSSSTACGLPGPACRSLDAGGRAATVDSGHGDLFAFGRGFLATSDLVQLRTAAPLNEQRQELFCSGGAEGYTVFPRVG